MTDKPSILLIEARNYEELADELATGAMEVLDEAGAVVTRISVPGVLDIPSALSMALIGAEVADADVYDGYVLLGVVIRSETSRYEIVANESARAIMSMVTSEGLALGNGIQTVENQDQARGRVKRTNKNNGADAARTALAMIDVKKKFGL
ncbi:6,7-dimethyl-8-ribityllumazine synthase [Maritalea sp.]|uniref:6,7-dimethyl-8-ribityllumazine synthase n=1 Tax=Maritalea sp. TaxID=2003361 RepID=UPI003EF24051